MQFYYTWICQYYTQIIFKKTNILVFASNHWLASTYRQTVLRYILMPYFDDGKACICVAFIPDLQVQERSDVLFCRMENCLASKPKVPNYTFL